MTLTLSGMSLICKLEVIRDEAYGNFKINHIKEFYNCTKTVK